MLTLHLVRHGRTRYNDEGRVQGWCDSEITPAGLEDVEATAQHLAQVPFGAAYSSPSPRAVTTGKALLAHHAGVGLSLHDGLREFGFGEFEARPEPELFATQEPVELFREVFEGTFPGVPGGETGSGYMSRVAKAFTDIEAAHPDGGDVLVVSHGVTLMAYLAMVHEVPRRPLTNASVTTIEVDRYGGRTVTSLNVDPSGRAVVAPEIQMGASRVALEEAAAWH